jgi:hypothetical protein
MASLKRTRLTDEIGERITRAQFDEWTTNFKKWNEAYRRKKQKDEPLNFGTKPAQFFGEKIYLRLLSQPNCIGILTYYGIEYPEASRPGDFRLILVGMGADGKPQLPRHRSGKSGESEPEALSLKMRNEEVGEEDFSAYDRSHGAP